MAQNKKDEPQNKNQSQGQNKDSKSESLLGDAFKKILGASSSPVDLSKEIVSQVVGQVMNQVGKAKDEVTQRTTQEILAIIRKIDFVNEFSKFAENHKFKVSAEIEIIKKDNSKKEN